MRLIALLVSSSVTLGVPVFAEIKLPHLVGDHMVLQRDMQAAVWGSADPGETVTVKFRDTELKTEAGAGGRWKVLLPPRGAGGPYEMRLQGKNTIVLTDILVGEVWVASGQSNMEWPVNRSAQAEQEIARADYPEIRLFTVERSVAPEPREDVEGSWSPASPQTVAGFSAVAYYFGRHLHEQLKVPIGLIHSSWGGTPAEAWTSRFALQSDLSLQPLLWNWKKVLLEYPTALEQYRSDLKKWEEEAERAKTEGKPQPRRPAQPRGPGHHWTPAGLFNGMIAPLTPYAIRGAIWYQGESNAQPYRSYEYRSLFQTLIRDWRRQWDQGPFPFLFAQLANFRERKVEPSESHWAELREAQTMALALPNTAMAVAIDIGEADDIHPKNKQQVGYRLGLAARAVAYGERLVYSGPIYRGMSLEGSRIRIRFTHTGTGLAAPEGGGLKGFSIAGRDRQFVWAEARLDGDTVVVSNPSVPNPVAVRYAWADNPEATLYNRESLPASPFRTDDWQPGDHQRLPLPGGAPAFR